MQPFLIATFNLALTMVPYLMYLVLLPHLIATHSMDLAMFSFLLILVSL